MTVVVVLAFALVAAAGTAVVLSRDAQRQAITLSTLGLTLTVLFLVLQAPDVALSQLAIGAAVVPLMVMLTLREISQHPSRKDRSARS
jgi:energy-converting hydrogenase B subunit D